MSFLLRVVLFAVGVGVSWLGLHSRFPFDIVLLTPMYCFAVKVAGDLTLKNLDLVSFSKYKNNNKEGSHAKSKIRSEELFCYVKPSVRR